MAFIRLEVEVTHQRLSRRLLLGGLLIAGVGVTGCKKAPPSAPPAGPAEVGVITVTAETITRTRELPGRTAAFRVAEVRARVNGIVQRRLFEEGAEVREGQALFQIDSRPYRAAVSSAEAGLARARATESTRKLLADRYAQLLDTKGVSQQEYDDATAAYRAAAADVAAGKAAVEVARINLGYSRVTAPIGGRIGRSEVTEGAYVQQAQATLMATIQQLDPIYVDVTQAITEVQQLQRQLDRGELVRAGGGAKVRLVLEDGSLYAEQGTLQFSGVTVNPGTGSITLRALFPNPKGELLPGMFVRARLEEGTAPEALLVPQAAVRRDAQGNATVLVVNGEGKVEPRVVEAPRAIGERWQITRGLEPGARVVVDGLQKVRPGSQVVAVPVTSGAPAGASPSAAPPGRSAAPAASRQP